MLLIDNRQSQVFELNHFLYKGVRSGPAMIEVFGWSNVLLGTAVAMISALVAVKFLVHIISRYGLAFFAYYRLALAAVLLLFMLF